MGYGVRHETLRGQADGWCDSEQKTIVVNQCPRVRCRPGVIALAVLVGSCSNCVLS
jgi:hypothetical protein